jgi:hypothetical protein
VVSLQPTPELTGVVVEIPNIFVGNFSLVHKGKLGDDNVSEGCIEIMAKSGYR